MHAAATYAETPCDHSVSCLNCTLAAAAACYVDDCSALYQCLMLLCSTVVLDCMLCLLCSSSCRSAAAAAPVCRLRIRSSIPRDLFSSSRSLLCSSRHRMSSYD
jgi:hypothetical protein